jgi:hypothetical protein
MDPFGREALSELVTQIDIDAERADQPGSRSSLHVVLTGTESAMTAFFDMEPRLKSRISELVRTTSFTPDNIADVAEAEAAQSGVTLDPDARTLIVDAASRLQQSGSPESGNSLLDIAGNGRFARNIVTVADQTQNQRLSGQYGVRLSEIPDAELTLLSADDVREALDYLIAFIPDATSSSARG